MLINTNYPAIAINPPTRTIKKSFRSNSDVFIQNHANKPAFTGKIPLISTLTNKYKNYQAQKAEQALKAKEEKELKEAIKKEEEYAKSLGVKANYGSSLHSAITINKCLTIANEKGFLLPTEVTTGDKYFDLYENDPSTMAIIGLKCGRMFIRESIIPKLIDCSRTKMNKYEFLVFHEIGHYNLFQSYERQKGENSYDKFKEPFPDFNNRDLIIDELGYHASSSVDEFGADIFAKLMGEEPISESIMEEYHSTCAKHLKPYFWKN